jgi:hypothetical protein
MSWSASALALSDTVPVLEALLYSNFGASALALSDTVPVLEALLYSNFGAIMTSKHICSNKMMFSLFTWDNPDGSRSKSSGSADSSMVCERACNRSCSVDVVVALYGIALTMAMAGVSFVVGFIPAVGVRPTVAVANRGVSFSGGRDSSTRFSVAFGRAGNFWSSSFWMIRASVGASVTGAGVSFVAWATGGFIQFAPLSVSPGGCAVCFKSIGGIGGAGMVTLKVWRDSFGNPANAD